MAGLGVRIFSLFEGVTIALDSLRANKVRAALTILGVAVGVFVVVVISAAIHGINTSVARDFEKAGPTTFSLSRYPITFESCDGTDDTCKWLHNPRLTFADAKVLNALSSVEAAGAPWLAGWSGIDGALVAGWQINRLHGERRGKIRTSHCERRRN